MIENHDFEAKYWELRAKLQIHESHSHERALEYVNTHNERHAAAQKIIAKASKFSDEVIELSKVTW